MSLNSLASLRDFTMDQGDVESDGEGMLGSVISVLPPHEIQRMIQEVQDLDEDMVKVRQPPSPESLVLLFRCQNVLNHNVDIFRDI